MPSHKLILRAPGRVDALPSAGRWFVAMMLAALISGLVLSGLLPAPLVLPTLAIALVVPGFAIAALLWASGLRMDSHPAPWEAVGALIFVGFAAGILSDVDQALTVLDQSMPATGERAER